MVVSEWRIWNREPDVSLSRRCGIQGVVRYHSFIQLLSTNVARDPSAGEVTWQLDVSAGACDAEVASHYHGFWRNEERGIRRNPARGDFSRNQTGKTIFN